MITIKDLALKIKNQESLISGGRWCAGCSFPPIIRTVLAAKGDNDVIVTNATGCLEVTSTIYPYNAWGIPYMHNAFENSAPTLNGIEEAYNYLKKDNVKSELKDKIKNKNIKFVAFSGDGGTYDIGLQALSGAMERGHDFLYVCYDNGAYMNTGNQRSSATPFGASSSTSPDGKVHHGKEEQRKDLIKIALAHNIKYVAQASVYNLVDLYNKAEKAFAINGPKLILVFSPCIANWQFQEGEAISVAKLATETNFWPLYEVEDGKYKINFKPAERKPIEEFLKMQNRFRHLFKDKEGREIIKKIQENIDIEWQKLLDLENFTNK